MNPAAPGTGLSNRWTAEQERADAARIAKLHEKIKPKKAAHDDL